MESRVQTAGGRMEGEEVTNRDTCEKERKDRRRAGIMVGIYRACRE